MRRGRPARSKPWAPPSAYHRAVSRSRAVALALSVTFVAGLFLVLPRLGAQERSKDGRDGLYGPLGLFTEVLTLVRSNYVEPVEVQPLLSGAFAGMTEAMDPFSEYVPPERMKDFREATEAAKAPGVVDSGVVLARRFGYPVVVAAAAGSPAAAAGLKSDDLIERIGEHPTRSMALWDVAGRLSGKAGSRVSLRIVRDGGKPRHRNVELVLGAWSPEAPSLTRAEGEVVVRIPGFGDGTADKVRSLLAPLDRSRAILIDVRGAASGSFDEAARVAALFAPPGPVGELKGKRIEGRKWSASPGERVHEGRTVVLVDSGTAGAAELFAAAVRGGTPAAGGAEGTGGEEGAPDPVPTPSPDAKAAEWRSKLVGEPTFGMGAVQQVVALSSGGALRISVGKVHGPSGRPLSPRGLTPDERVYPVPEVESPNPPDQILKRGLKLLASVPAPAAS